MSKSSGTFDKSSQFASGRVRCHQEIKFGSILISMRFKSYTLSGLQASMLQAMK